MGRNLLMLGLLLAALAIGLTLLNRYQTQKSSGPAPGSVRAPATPAIRGKQMAEFALQDVNGKTMKPADFKGKVLLVNFWATWCGPCLVEIPWFKEFQNKYGPEGFQVIGISMDEGGVKDVAPFIQKHSLTYPILLGNEDTASQFGGIIGLPTSYLVDRDGKFYNMHRGLVSRESIEMEIKELLKQAPAATAQQAPPRVGQLAAAFPAAN